MQKEKERKSLNSLVVTKYKLFQIKCLGGVSNLMYWLNYNTFWT